MKLSGESLMEKKWNRRKGTSRQEYHGTDKKIHFVKQGVQIGIVMVVETSSVGSQEPVKSSTVWNDQNGYVATVE